MLNLKDFIEEMSTSETSWEIDLSPLLALMVTLIPVLLLQASFVTLGMLDTTLPVLSDTKEEKKDPLPPSADFDLDIFAKENYQFEVLVTVDNRVVKKVEIESKDKKFDFEKLNAELVAIKKDYPEELSAEVTPEDKVGYEQIIKTLDVVRKNNSGESIRFEDKKGQKLETALLFPDVVFGNVAD